MTLPEIIEAFKQENAQLGIGIHAFAQCDHATYSFIRFAYDHGYDGELRTYSFNAATDATVREPDQPNPDPEIYNVGSWAKPYLNDDSYTMCHWHMVIDAGHVLIDFTARQYRHRYAFPHIIPISERAYAAKAGAR